MARSFAGTAYLTRSSAIVTAAPLTISIQSKQSSSSSNYVLFSICAASGSTNGIFRVWCFSTSDARAGAVAGATFDWSSLTGLSLNNTWAHLAAVFTSATSRQIFVNGTGATVNTTSITPASLDQTNISSQFVDASNTRNLYLAGDVAEVAVWNVALTSNEITSLSKGFSPRFIRPASLVSYWPLGGCFGSDDRDRWKSKLDMTPTNSPTFANHWRVIYPLVG